jgi:hypothetical protein
VLIRDTRYRMHWSDDIEPNDPVEWGFLSHQSPRAEIT